jgi:hypothetical protein
MQTLADKGILVYDSAEGKKLSFAGIDPALDSLISATKPTVDAISLRLTGRFWAAATYASACLRWGSIEQTVLSIQRKRLICGKESPPITSYRVSDLVNAFYVLRYFYPREYLCLFDSLALLRFLAQYRFFPQWVFGVKLTPFAAHCWVQDRTLILNDTVENVQKYTPIMAI